MVLKPYEEAMIETYLYFAEPVDIHTIRTILGSKLPESPSDMLVFVDDSVRVEIQYAANGFPPVERNVWSSDGPFLEQVASWGRLHIMAWSSNANTYVTNALLPLLWLAPYLKKVDVDFMWFDPFSQEVNWGFDPYDVTRYLESAEQLAI